MGLFTIPTINQQQKFIQFQVRTYYKPVHKKRPYRFRLKLGK